MIGDRKVVAWIPYGRARTVSILFEYLRRDHLRGQLDELWLYLNTDSEQVDDLRYAYQLARSHDWVHIKERPTGCVRQSPKQRNTGYAYRYMTDPATTYLRFDDDIVYVHPEAITRLVTAKLEMPESMCVFPIIWNNAICSWFAQQLGHIPHAWGTVRSPYCMDPMGWANGGFAVSVHGLLLDHIEQGTVDELLWYQDYSLQVGQQFSVSCFAAAGADYADLQTPGVLVPDEEESWHTIHRTRATQQPNMIRGDALVSHYTFKPQGPIVEASNVLDRYRALAEKVRAALDEQETASA
jgi:hypothetical protein